MFPRHFTGRVLRRLSSGSKQAPPGEGGPTSNVKEPAISLQLNNAEVNSPSSSRLSTPLSYYLDTHNVIVQLQRAGSSHYYLVSGVSI